MKYPLILLATLVFPAVYVWGNITQKNNAPRSGDTIIKQEVVYKDPGRAGENVIWDFGKLTPVKEDYTVVYSSPSLINNSFYLVGKDTIPAEEINPDELIVGTEKEMDYYYLIKNGILTLLYHQDINSAITYMPAIPVQAYEPADKKEIAQPYTSYITYIHAGNTSYKGEVVLGTDATGIMVLPNKDTLRNVTRTHQVITMYEEINAQGQYIAGTQGKYKMEYYRWFVKGYRYPIFETAKHYFINDKQDDEYFSTAFFLTPQKRYYLTADSTDFPVIQQNKDTLSNSSNNIIDIPNPVAVGDNDDNPAGDNETPKLSWLDANFTYNYFPNPVNTDLNIEYHLYDDATVSISIASINGTMIKALPPVKRNQGLYTENIDCSSLPAGNYILIIKANEYTNSHVLVKR